MATDMQKTGDYGEKLVAKTVDCPGCKRQGKTLRLLPTNFRCADLICDFCGYLAQVKTKNQDDVDTLPKQILGAAWKPQSERMESGIFFPLFIVLLGKQAKSKSIWYLPRDLQSSEMFVPRKPLGHGAKRAGWQGFYIELEKSIGLPTRLI